MNDKAITRRDFIKSAGAAAAGIGMGSLSDTAATAAVEQGLSRLPMKILTHSGLDAEYVTRIEAISPQITLIHATTDDQWGRELPEADVIYGGFSEDDLSSAGRLKWIQWGAAGVEHILYPRLVDSSIILTNAKGCYAPEIAEHVFGLLFGLTRGIARQVRQMKDHRWGGSGRLIEMRGMTLGIVGFGGIGRETARRAKAMDMRVIAVDAEPMYKEHYPMADEIHLVDDWLPELLKQSDVVVCAAPHTRRSEGMFGSKEFGLMKDGSHFINVSRGKLVQTPALVNALKEGKLAGTGLDVTDPEPLPSEHELWDIPDVVITSHTAGQSQFSGARVQGLFIENVRRFAAGLPLLNVVDKVKGY